MRRHYLFAEQATICNVIEYQRKLVRQALEGLPAQKVLANPAETVTAEIVQRFRIDIPVLDRNGIVQLPNEEVDIDISDDFARAFRTPGPHYVKGTALRIAIPFTGEAEAFKHGSSPLNNPIEGEVRGNTVVLTHAAERPDVTAAQNGFDNRVGQIERMLQRVRDPAEQWNRELADMVRTGLEQRRAKLERDQGLTLRYPAAPPNAALARTQERAIKPRAEQYDLFLCHASEDKEAIARPLYSALVAAGVSVWFDEAVLKLGDSLRRKIDQGHARCRYGVVILSPTFLAKQWPQRELDGLVARETASGEKAILPIWHGLDRDTVLRYSPPLADRLAGRSEEGISALVESILRVLR